LHQAAFDYVRRVLAGFDLTGKHVVEIGSYNVNGTVRGLFGGAASYVGVDAREGPGVDLARKAQNLRADTFDQPADVVVCCEVLEHDEDAHGIIRAAHRILAPGGVLIVTAAGPGREPHGVDGGRVGKGEHYGNIEPDELRAWLDGWDGVTIEENHAAHDIYAVAVKREAEPEKAEPKAKKDA
jgi:SAM-dependent methyltransferase